MIKKPRREGFPEIFDGEQVFGEVVGYGLSFLVDIEAKAESTVEKGENALMVSERKLFLCLEGECEV